MKLLSDSQVKRIFEAYGHAVELQREAGETDSPGKLEGIVDALVSELSAVSDMVLRNRHLKDGYYGEGDVRLCVEAEVSESGEDANFFVLTQTGETVDVTDLVFKAAPTDAMDIIDAVLGDVDLQERRYGRVDFRIEKEREGAHG
jgi:hypothetical protein